MKTFSERAQQVAHLVDGTLFPILAQLMRKAHGILNRLGRDKGLGMRHRAFPQLGNFDVVLDFRNVKFSSSHLRVLCPYLGVR
jgi:hypothetical protein